MVGPAAGQSKRRGRSQPERWETLIAGQTPTDKFFQVAHYNKPVIDEKAWKLEVTGLVRRPLALSFADLQSRPPQEVVSHP